MLCPNGHDTVETLADRYRCLVCGQYINMDGSKARGGPEWTSAIHDGQIEEAKRKIAAHKAQKKAK